ncbi:uridine kinase [Chlorobaculum sp. 24CR]|uniref:uridine kinase family protein n=1 Tax=Chlorobaculum sp. 24CR TaxID=2508878 RepID=UPI001FD715EA|nr:adenylyl-sulfate kinase [Chlorobaculum sp. 24CR]
MLMLNDVLLIRQEHLSAAAVICERIVSDMKVLCRTRPGHKFIVAISGESGSGKSELAHTLAKALKKAGVQPKILHTDNYYRVSPAERLPARIADNFEHVGAAEYDWDLLKSNINDFRTGRMSLMPCIDIITGQLDRFISDFSGVEVLVVDGLYALGIKDADLCVYIDLSWRETRKSQQLRGKEEDDDYRMRVLEKESEDVKSFRYRADLVIDHQYNVHKVAAPDDLPAGAAYYRD